MSRGGKKRKWEPTAISEGMGFLAFHTSTSTEWSLFSPPSLVLRVFVSFVIPIEAISVEWNHQELWRSGENFTMSDPETRHFIQTKIDLILEPKEKGLSPVDFMQCYTLIHNFCTSSEETEKELSIHIGGSDLYYALQSTLAEYLKAKPCTDLAFYSHEWLRYVKSAQVLNSLFNYLNRMWIKRKLEELHQGIYDINTLCLISWRDGYLRPHEHKIVQNVLSLIEKERKGERIERYLVETVTTSLVTLGIDTSDFKKKNLEVYQNSFERGFLTETERFYKEQSEKFVSNHSCTDYLIQAESYLKEEEERVAAYLDPSTAQLLIPLVEKTLLYEHKDFIQQQFIPLLERDRLDDLSRMYTLLNRVPETLATLRDQFETFVKEQGLSAISKLIDPSSGKTEVDPKQYADCLLAVYSKYHRIVASTFQSEAGFETSLDKGCREFVNRNDVCPNSTKSSEFLSKYADQLLRKSARLSEDSEMEDSLNGCLTIFKFIEDKDVFQKFYSKNLAKRLVNGMSASDDAESMMISKLKEQCGYEYTSKLQRMFTDMSISKDLNQGFKYVSITRASYSESDIDFSILVQCSGSWPLTVPTQQFTIPEEV
jgi:cullin 1